MMQKEGKQTTKRWKNCKRRKRDPCVVCKAEGVCTMRNILTGQVWIWKINSSLFNILSGQAQYIYQQQYKAEHRVGGPDQTFRNPVGLRFSFCLVGDLCQVRLFFRLKQHYYRSLSFLTTGSTIAWRSGKPLLRRSSVKRREGFPWWQKTKNLKTLRIGV